MYHLAKSFNVTFQVIQGGNFAFYQSPKQEKGIGFFMTEGYMNESGKLIKPLLELKSFENFIVAHDYLDSNLGVVKIKEGGSAE